MAEAEAQDMSEESGEGNTRRTSLLIAGAVGVAVLLLVALVSSLVAGDGDSEKQLAEGADSVAVSASPAPTATFETTQPTV